MRTEKDSLGELKIDSDALYGIHSVRALANFPDTSLFDSEWYKALALAKLACYQTAKDFIEKASEKGSAAFGRMKLPNLKLLHVLMESAKECAEGKHFEHLIVPAISGGAGTSINMNMNEIIANCSLVKLGFKAGDYTHADPVEDANIFQSTNDVIPTSLRLASMNMLNTLESGINLLRSEIESKEKEYRNALRLGYTQMQEAVPTTFGRLFSTYTDALSRDWWRISKCLERIKVVNLGGSAIGTSVTVPRYFTIEVVKTLQKLSELPVTRSENLSDATNNLDSLVEVHGILKTHAVNLEKMVNDLRLLSSDLHSPKELHIPEKQVGSSIMPGKINPVIPEFIISSVHRVYANDILITQLSAQGCLELNAYLPVIGHALLESLKLLIACNETCRTNLIAELKIDTELAMDKLLKSPSLTTVLLPFIGYNKAAKLADLMKLEHIDIFQANKQMKMIDEIKLKEILKPGNLVQGGYSLKDLEDN